MSTTSTTKCDKCDAVKPVLGEGISPHGWIAIYSPHCADYCASCAEDILATANSEPVPQRPGRLDFERLQAQVATLSAALDAERVISQGLGEEFGPMRVDLRDRVEQVRMLLTMLGAKKRKKFELTLHRIPEFAEYSDARSPDRRASSMGDDFGFPRGAPRRSTDEPKPGLLAYSRKVAP